MINRQDVRIVWLLQLGSSQKLPFSNRPQFSRWPRLVVSAIAFDGSQISPAKS